MRTIDSTTLAYIAGFLDGDGSVFFQIVPRKDYRFGFEIRPSVAFYQKASNAEILHWLKEYFGKGYIRVRGEMCDYTVVGRYEVKDILLRLQPYVRLKKKHIELGLQVLEKLENLNSEKDFLEICRLVDNFGKINYSKKRKQTYAVVEAHFANSSLPL